MANRNSQKKHSLSLLRRAICLRWLRYVIKGLTFVSSSEFWIFVWRFEFWSQLLSLLLRLLQRLQVPLAPLATGEYVVYQSDQIGMKKKSGQFASCIKMAKINNKIQSANFPGHCVLNLLRIQDFNNLEQEKISPKVSKICQFDF